MVFGIPFAAMLALTPALLIQQLVFIIEVQAVIQGLGPFKRATMQDSLTDFIDSLALPSSQGNSLTTQLTNDPHVAAYLNGSSLDPSLLVSAACQALQMSIGVDSVESEPLEKADVDANWYCNVTSSPIG